MKMVHSTRYCFCSVLLITILSSEPITVRGTQKILLSKCFHKTKSGLNSSNDVILLAIRAYLCKFKSTDAISSWRMLPKWGIVADIWSHKCARHSAAISGADESLWFLLYRWVGIIILSLPLTFILHFSVPLAEASEAVTGSRQSLRPHDELSNS
jgi:hypothetical protein